MKVQFDTGEEEKILETIKERIEEMNPREITDLINFLGLMPELMD